MECGQRVGAGAEAGLQVRAEEARVVWDRRL